MNFLIDWQLPERTDHESPQRILTPFTSGTDYRDNNEMSVVLAISGAFAIRAYEKVDHETCFSSVDKTTSVFHYFLIFASRIRPTAHNRASAQFTSVNRSEVNHVSKSHERFKEFSIDHVTFGSWCKTFSIGRDCHTHARVTRRRSRGPWGSVHGWSQKRRSPLHRSCSSHW
jgi:hypothetical protein